MTRQAEINKAQLTLLELGQPIVLLENKDFLLANADKCPVGQIVVFPFLIKEG